MDLGVPKSISLPPSMSGFGKFHVQDDSTQRLHPQILVPTKMVIYFGTPNFRKYIYIYIYWYTKFPQKQSMKDCFKRKQCMVDTWRATLTNSPELSNENYNG